MKLTIEVDCTPDEARQFCGLPDLKPLHAAVMGRVEQRMLRAVDATAPENILKSWLSLAPPNLEQFWSMFGRFMPPISNPPGRDKS